LDIRKAFGYVRDDVMSATGDQQEPYTTNSLGGNDVTLVAAPAAQPAASAGADLRGDYELAERVGTREAWESFLATHPSGFYADLARAQRNKLASEEVRIAATEKARAAAEEQARLAAEGARASEQARAAAQSKAADQAKLAAEKLKQDEDAKVAAAEQVRIAAQAAEQATKPQQTKTASAEPAAPGQDKTDADKSAAAALASLAPRGAAPEPPNSDRPAPQDIPRLLQSELRRVGCKTGEIDGEWNASARRALSSFNDHAGTRLDIKIASIDALDAVKAKTGRVCPLDCERGTRADGDHCVKITCDDDQVLGPSGTCRARPERAPKVAAGHERRSPAAHGRCFAFNGRQACE
jgi:hypothetical protein